MPTVQLGKNARTQSWSFLTNTEMLEGEQEKSTVEVETSSNNLLIESLKTFGKLQLIVSTEQISSEMT
jgi:hypothetical protein